MGSTSAPPACPTGPPTSGRSSSPAGPTLWFWAGDFDAGVDDLGYRELYLRWFQYAAWLPMFRSHGTDTPRELWRFGEPGEPVYDALVAALQLRYRLLPYIYSLAGWTTQRAYTMLRSLPFDFRDDPAVYDVADQFMFGPAFLVCPVHEPMAHGPGSTRARRRPRRAGAVYLPAGQRLVRPLDRAAAPRRTGPSTPRLRSSASRSSCEPARSCRWDRSASTRTTSPTRRSRSTSTRVATARFRLYEDEGDGYAYEAGAFADDRASLGRRRSPADRSASAAGELPRDAARARRCLMLQRC